MVIFRYALPLFASVFIAPAIAAQPTVNADEPGLTRPAPASAPSATLAPASAPSATRAPTSAPSATRTPTSAQPSRGGRRDNPRVPVSVAAPEQPAEPTLDATSGRTLIGRAELATGLYLESHVYALDSIDGIGGRLLLGGRYRLTQRVVVGLEAVMPWYAPSDDQRQGGAAFGNLAFVNNIRLFGDATLHGTLSFKVYIPTFVNYRGIGARQNVGVSFAADVYEPGFYLDQYMTFRPGFRLFARFGGFALAAEAGFGVPIYLDDGHGTDLVAGKHLGNLYTGLKLGYAFGSGRYYAYWETTLSKIFDLSDDPFSRGGDLAAQVLAGPGFKLQVGRFEAGLAVILPLTEDVRQTVDVSFALQLGVRL